MPCLGVVAQDACLALLVGLRADGRVNHLVEGAVEIVDHLHPRDVAVGDAVEFLFDAGREVIVYDRLELRFEVVVDDHADVRRRKAVLLLAVAFREVFRGELVAREGHLYVAAFLPLLVLLDHVAAIDDRRDGRRIGRGASDAQFFEALDQRGFVVTRRGLREALRGGDLRRKQFVALGHLREQPFAAFGGLVVVRGFGVEAQEAVEADDFARGDELLRRPRHVDHDGRAVEFGADHLRSYGALPDQVVEFLFGRGAFDRLAVDIRRADSLVRLLGPLGLGLIVMP